MATKKKYQATHCSYCKRPMTASHLQKDTSATRDHRILQCKGGGHDPENLVPSCFRCNNLRGDTDQEIFDMFARDIVCQYPDAPTPVLRIALRQFIDSLAQIAIRNRKEARRAISLSLLSVAERLRAL